MQSLSVLFIIVLALLASQPIFTQELCPGGKFYSEAAQSCESCQPGTFANGTVPLSECQACPPGTTARYQDSKECIPCEADFYSLNTTHCQLCPAGAISEKGSSECTLCPDGSIRTGNYSNGVRSSICFTCPAGTYADRKVNCFGCPRGRSSPEGSYDVSHCIPCQPGYIFPFIEGLIGPCTMCPAGKYEVNRTKCETCPQGNTSPAGAQDISECTPCQAGTRPVIGSTECVKCQAGTYEVNRSTCTFCPNGMTSPEGSKDQSACTRCEPGYYSPWHTGLCLLCAAGSFEFNRTDCYQCPSGTFSAGGVSGSCTPCESGKMARNAGSDKCEKCGPGYYARSTTYCERCPYGSFGQDGTCSKCPSGTLYVNSTYCKEVDASEVKSGNSVMGYFLGIGLVAVLLCFALYKHDQKKSEKELRKNLLIYQDEDNKNSYY